MLNVLKVLGRVMVIGIGLLSIAGGGLCVVLGSSSGGVNGVAQIGLVSLVLGVAGVWLMLRRWKGERAAQPPGDEQQP